MSIFDVVKAASTIVDDFELRDCQAEPKLYLPRSTYSVLASTMSEIGELAEEVMISENHSYKKPGADGIIGEAIDSIACLLDLIHKVDPSLTETDIEIIASQKCAKWMLCVKQRRGL